MTVKSEAPSNGAAARYPIEREHLVEQLRARGIHDERVLTAFLKVPRELFVAPAFRGNAYSDSPVPIGEGQTISQPYTVAYMTEAIAVKPGDKVLEIGTGSGYQAAILAELGAKVYTIERFITLLEEARKRLEALGYHVVSRAGDGSRGWEEFAPYDAIIVTAGAPDVPESLTKQLNPKGGKLLVPIGDRKRQRMYRVTRNGEELKAEELPEFSFVPLVGKEGWSDR